MLQQDVARSLVDTAVYAIVHNNYLPQLTIQTDSCDVEIKVPKVRDYSSNKICFKSLLLAPYLKRAKA
ncbi:MAG: hypothetical protein ACTS73_01855 [Arsenophonus sp. NEOnobi-MAG3]